MTKIIAHKAVVVPTSLPLLRLLLLLLVVLSLDVITTAAEATTSTKTTSNVVFHSENAMPKGNIVDLKFQSRITLPYGPDLYSDPPQPDTGDQPYRGYGFAMDAAEQIVYDPIHKYMYSMSDVGYIIIVDYKNPTMPVLTNFSFPAGHEKLGQIFLCGDKLFVSLTKLHRVDIYSTIQRHNPSMPALIKSVDCGPNAKTVIVNQPQCDTIVVANTNTGNDFDQGSVTIIRDFMNDKPDITTIPLDYDTWDDKYLIRRGLNMPLTKAALEYWDDHSANADDFDFQTLRENYKSAIFLEPENLAFGAKNEVLVNLQENNGLLRINMTDLTAVAVAGYGLKDHSIVPIDLNDQDNACHFKTYPSLFAMRNPDTIQTLQYNDKYYVITANEAGGKVYGDWEEEFNSQELFEGNQFGLHNVMVPEYIFDPANPSAGHSALFNDGCNDHQVQVDAATGETTSSSSDCLGKIKMSIGSNSIDYQSDPSNPIFYRMVLFGGRGWSIYELPQDPDDLLKLVFDSGDIMERVGCQTFPWAHNGRIDDEYAPTVGPNNTYFAHVLDDEKDREDILANNDPNDAGCLDQGDGTPGACPMPHTVDVRSGKDGPAIENVVIGQACGRLVAAMATEKQSIAMVFDITDITSPDLIKVFHLSPSVKNKSLGLAYNDGTLGEIDPESAVFVTAEESPSGKAGIFWAGAQSGTISFWEFECKEKEASRKDGNDEGASSGAAGRAGTSRLSSSSCWCWFAMVPTLVFGGFFF